MVYVKPAQLGKCRTLTTRSASTAKLAEQMILVKQTKMAERTVDALTAPA